MVEMRGNNFNVELITTITKYIFSQYK